jgi:bifunctional non-homologous end joining protein LigD
VQTGTLRALAVQSRIGNKTLFVYRSFSTLQVMVTITNPNKVYWPQEGYTKGDLIAYYESIAEYILPYMKDRPQSLNRHPNGITGQNFFQKDVSGPPEEPDFVKTITLKAPTAGRNIRYIVCDNKETIVYMANLGCIEMNPWNSRVGSLDKPDWLIFDLDPEAISFSAVIKVAQHVRTVLEKIGAAGYCKTSGKRGLHIYVPLGAKYTYQRARAFAKVVAEHVQRTLPAITSVERHPSKRQKKVYIDYLQNSRGQTLAAPYSVRPTPGATVATPLAWDEVKGGLDPKKFTIKNIGKRLKAKGDLWQPVLGQGIAIEQRVERLKSQD